MKKTLLAATIAALLPTLAQAEAGGSADSKGGVDVVREGHIEHSRSLDRSQEKKTATEIELLPVFFAVAGDIAPDCMAGKLDNNSNKCIIANFLKGVSMPQQGWPNGLDDEQGNGHWARKMAQAVVATQIIINAAIKNFADQTYTSPDDVYRMAKKALFSVDLRKLAPELMSEWKKMRRETVRIDFSGSKRPIEFKIGNKLFFGDSNGLGFAKYGIDYFGAGKMVSGRNYTVALTQTKNVGFGRKSTTSDSGKVTTSSSNSANAGSSAFK